jgi:hypothetical protein
MPHNLGQQKRLGGNMRVTRFLAASAGAVVLSIGLSGVAGAQTGQTGNYLFIDSSSTPGAVCKYERVSDTRAKIYQITVKAPQVWWPDRNSDNNTEHGKVGWRAIIDHTNAGPGFVKLKQSAIQYATAYEGYPGGYDLADKAPFTNISVGITASDLPSGDELRVKVKAIWFKKDGTQLGSVTHTVVYYTLKISTGGTIQTMNVCPKNVFFN